jgi:hypothetical protein
MDRPPEREANPWIENIAKDLAGYGVTESIQESTP